MQHRWLIALGALFAVLALCACAGSSSSSSSVKPAAGAGASRTSSAGGATGSAATSSGPAPQLGFEGVRLEPGPELASSGSTGTGTVHGIQCGSAEQLAYHIHAHLSVYVNGRPYALPAGIGIPGSTIQTTAQGPVAAGGQCIYWLHTHTADGVVHIESPTQRIYTLGEFFDEWRQPLTTTQVGTVGGKLTALLNGRPWSKSLRALPLLSHALIQLNVGRPPAAAAQVNWSQTGL